LRENRKDGQLLSQQTKRQQEFLGKYRKKMCCDCKRKCLRVKAEETASMLLLLVADNDQKIIEILEKKNLRSEDGRSKELSSIKTWGRNPRNEVE
jgi:hypothetical protein